MTRDGLGTVYTLGSADEAERFYDGWAEGYEAELEAGGYVTPQRCAEALATHAADLSAPLADFGCGTGLSGLALKAAGFTCIDGFDISEGMRAKAEAKGVYRNLDHLDLSQPLDGFEPGAYQNAAAIGVLNPNFMPASVIDEMLGLLSSGGCFVLSINDQAIADGSLQTRILELTEHGVADLLIKDYGEHIPSEDLRSTVYLLKKR